MNTPPTASRLWTVWTLPTLLALILFAPAVGFDFINYDDNAFVYANPHVIGGFSLENLRWAFTTVHEQWWLPVLWISYMADSTLLGTDPWGYHLVNVLLHAANAGLLGWILFRMTGSKWRSVLVAALFAAHPLRIEAVAWVTARKDVLSGLFFMLGLLAYVRHVERPSIVRMALVATCLLLGLMSKGNLVIFPLLLLLLDLWPLHRAELVWAKPNNKKWRKSLVEKIPLFLLAGIFIAINLHTHISGTGVGLHVPILARVAFVPGNVWTYLRLVFWPMHLSVIYPEHDVVQPLTTLAALLGLTGITALGFWQVRRRPDLLVGWLWFLVALFPIVRGVRLGYAAYADRFTYLPSIGLSIALVWSLDGSRYPKTGKALLLLLLAICSLQTTWILPVWKDSIHLYTYSLQNTPDSPVLHNNLGTALMDNHRHAESVEHFEKTVSLDPGFLPAWANWALALHKLERFEECRAVAAQGLDQGLDAPQLNHELACLSLGQQPDNLVAPEGTLAFRDVGRLMESGSLPAFFMFREMSASFPKEFFAVQTDYVRLWHTGEKDRAWRFFVHALAATPNDFLLLNNLAWLLATDPESPANAKRTLLLAERAHRLVPSAMQTTVLDTLSAALAANGQFEDAQKNAQQALDLARKAGDENTAAQIENRLEVYRQHKPWRETP